MPNLFTRRARLRWLEMQREKAREAWERLGRLYIGLYGRVLDGICNPSEAMKVQIVMARVRFYLQAVVRQIAQERGTC